MRPMRVGGTAPSALLPLTLPQLPATTCGTHFSRDCHAAFAKVPPLLSLWQAPLAGAQHVLSLSPPLCCYATALEIRQGSCDQSSADFAAFILKLVKMLP